MPSNIYMPFRWGLWAYIRVMEVNIIIEKYVRIDEDGKEEGDFKITESCTLWQFCEMIKLGGKKYLRKFIDAKIA